MKEERAGGINEATVKEEIKRIDKLAKDLNLPIIDMHKALKTKPEMLPVHTPSPAGLAARVTRRRQGAWFSPELPQ